MIQIPRIVCPIDFSDVSRHALEHAVAIAKWYESELTALHVVEPDIMLPLPLLFAEAEALDAVERYEAVHAQLAAWLDDAKRAGLRTNSLVEEGKAARAIVRHATLREFDLVVMGTHGHSGFERWMLGSVAETVLRKAECPVLTVPPHSATAAKIPYTRLLCPVDFSPSSIEALRFAFSIAEEADAALTLLNVVDYPPDDDLLFARSEALEFRRGVADEARRQLDALLIDDMHVWCKSKTRLEYGRPYRQILSVAAEEAADLIVMGVHGRNPIDVALFGSTTNHVVRAAPCPVLTVRK
jgi:nucleotide-binding universal stress UspA family protein